MMAGKPQCDLLIGWQEYQEVGDGYLVFRCCDGTHLAWKARHRPIRTASYTP